MPYLEIAGGIASGKSTLLGALSRLDIRAVYENHEINPFWKAFYSDPTRFAFETEIGFLLQHYHFAKVSMSLGAVVVLDHSFELDLAYCQIGLTGKRREIFRSIYQEIRSELGWPNSIIWLRCRPEEEFRRIRNRGREIEQSVGIDFVSRLNRELESLIKSVRAQNLVPVLEVDSEEVDFRHSSSELSGLVAKLGLKGFGPPNLAQA